MGAAPWLASAGLLWAGFAYVGYPLVLALLSTRSRRPIPGDRAVSDEPRTAGAPTARDGPAPDVSVIVTVHDEERALPDKLANTLALDYPRPFELIVASDGSTDRSEEVARAFADRGVRLVALPERAGKEAAQAAAIGRARGAVLVFTDVAARLDEDALVELVRPFSDPEIGCVSSVDVVDAPGGEGAYVRYEMAVRALESRIGCLVGLSGSCFAVRRELCDPWPAELASDFRCALEALRRGFRTSSAAGARARFGSTRHPADEWRRRVRTARRGIAVLLAYPDLLHPRRGRVAFVLLGHKLARFTAWLGLAVAFGASLLAAPEHPLATALAGCGALGLALSGAALLFPTAGRLPAARLALHFLLLNAAMARAWLHHACGDRAVTWSPTPR